MTNTNEPRAPYVGAPDSTPSRWERFGLVELDDEVATHEFVEPELDVVTLSIELRVADDPFLDAQSELVAILRRLADRIESGALFEDAAKRPVLNSNGTTVGTVEFAVEYGSEQ